MNERRTNPPFLNGVPELLVLRLLSERPRHGYDLIQAIRDATAEELRFGEGCIYPILHRLEAEGHLRSSRESAGGRSRVVYHVTAKGRRQLSDSVAGWRRVADAVARVLQGDADAKPRLA